MTYMDNEACIGIIWFGTIQNKANFVKYLNIWNEEDKAIY